MKRKKFFICILCVFILWIVIAAVDFSMVHSYRKPIFCVGIDLADDGGSGKYAGLGYNFYIEGDFMPEDENTGITSYKGYIFGKEVSRRILDEMHPGNNDTPILNSVLTEPPTLNVIHHSGTTKALTGTSSWMYHDKDGNVTHIESDSLHPLQSKDLMTPLKLIPTTVSSIEPLKVYLKWDIFPDEVSVHCWSEEFWGQYDSHTDSEEISVNVPEADFADESSGKNIIIELKDGNYIYEVVAKWNRSEAWGGTAYYSFYTEKPDMEPQSIG